MEAGLNERGVGGHPLSRRDLLRRGALAGLGLAAGTRLGPSHLAAAPSYLRGGASGTANLRITRIVLQEALGRRATPVAPNAFAEYRGYRVREPLLRLQTDQGVEGITRVWNPDGRMEGIRGLLGKNPFELFEWEEGVAVRPVEEHRALLDQLYEVDFALFDLLGHAMNRPAADLLGPRAREFVWVYDSSLYQEDLLTEEQLRGVAYMEGRRIPADRSELLAYKADWLLNHLYREEGIRIFKIKTGRARWMESYRAALERDIAIFRAARGAMGPHHTLFVDVNNGYEEDYTATKRFIEETSDLGLFGIEEAFQEARVDEHRDVVEHSIALGLRVRNIDGEIDGIPYEVLEERVTGRDGTPLPLFAIDNPSFSHRYGFLDVRERAAHIAPLGVRVGPHNFASKIGFMASVHLGFAVPNWEYVETDDSSFPALSYPGVEIRDGKATLTGAPGLGIELDASKLERPSLVLEE